MTSLTKRATPESDAEIGKMAIAEGDTDACLRYWSDMAEVARSLEQRLGAVTEALEIIAGERQCIDNLMGNADIARETIAAIKEAKP